MENLENFIQRLSKAVGCYYHLIPSGTWYSLKKYESNKRGEMGVFGYVKKRGDLFIIDILERFVKKAGKSLHDYKIEKTINWGKPGVILIVNSDSDSDGDDYKEAVNVLKAVMEVR